MRFAPNTKASGLTSTELRRATTTAGSVERKGWFLMLQTLTKPAEWNLDIPPGEKDKYYEAALRWAKERGYRGDELPLGRRAADVDCPLGLATGLSIGKDSWSEIWPGRDYGRLPIDVGKFVVRFDSSFYPWLIEEASSACQG
jgi:hypothetical protein